MKIQIEIDDGVIDVSLSDDMLALSDAELADLLEQAAHQLLLKVVIYCESGIPSKS